MKTLKLVPVILLFCLNIHLLAQYEYPGEQDSLAVKHKKGRSTESKIFFGGNLSLWFGNTTYIDINPVIGYKITPRLWSGLGPMYKYQKDYFSITDYYYLNGFYYERTTDYYYETNIYGAKIFGQFTVFKDLDKTIKINLGDIFVYAENEFLNLEPVYFDQSTKSVFKGDRKWIDVALVGFGMRYNLGDRLGVSMMLLWDISQNPEYSYQNPEVRIGVNF